MNNDIQSKQFQQFYKALKKGSWTGKDKTLEEALVGNIRFEQHKEADDAGRIVEKIKVVKAKTPEERETFARHNTSNTSNVVEMIQKYMEQQLKANVNKLYRMKEEADKILDAELDKITTQYGTKINKNIPTNLKADIVKAANISKNSIKDVVGKMTVGKTGKTYNEAEEYSRFLRDYLGDVDVIFSTKDEIKKMLLELYDNSQIYLGDDFEAEIENVKKEKVSNEKVQQIVNEKMKSYNGKKKDKNKYKNKLINETIASENRRIDADYNNKMSSTKENAFEKYHGDILEAAHTYYLTEDAAFTSAKSQIIQSVADGKSKAPTDIKFDDYSEKIEQTKKGIAELELEMSKAVDIIVEKQLDDTNGVFASVGAEFRNLAEKMKTGSITDKDKKKIQKEIELAEKRRQDDIKKLNSAYMAEQKSFAGITKSKSSMENDKLALENKKKAYEALKSQMAGNYADLSVLGSEELFTQTGKIKVDSGRRLFGVSKEEMTAQDERIVKKENIEQIKKDAEIYKKMQEKPFTDEDQTELDKLNANLIMLERIEKSIKEGDYEAIKAYNEQSNAIRELLTRYEKINTDIDEKKNTLTEVTAKQNEINTLVNATQAPENIAKQEEKVSSIMATKNEAEGNVLGFGEHIQQMMKHFGSYMLRLRLVQRGIQDIVDAIGEFQKIDDEAFQLGMVSDMNINSIKRYRNEVLMLATNYRTTAEEILNTQSEIIKTGRTFDQAKQQVNASLILSKATFESLGDAGSLLNKMMLGLEMNGDKAYETMNKLYNVIQATPQSLAGLDAAMRQSGSAFSGLLDTISYSGSQLDDYKDGLAEAQMSLLGLVSLQGKTPMMAGTAVKTLIDKMRGPTDKALRSVNAELSLKKATDSNGNAITMKTIQNLTETDFTKAIELLSKLHKEGILSYQSIQDLFGPRNAATISKLLNQVNGDLESVNEELLTRRDVIEDSKKLDSSWSEEIEELKNSFRALKGVANDFGDSLKPVASILKKEVSGVADWAGNTDIGKSTVQTISAGITLGSIAKNGYYSLLAGSQAAKGNGVAMMGLEDNQRDLAQTAFMISSLSKNIKGLSESAKTAGGVTTLFSETIGNLKTGLWTIISSPITWWVAGIAAAVAILGYLYVKHKRLEGEINQSLINLEANSEKSKIALASLEESFDGLGKSLASITPTMFEASNGMNLLEDATKSLLDSLIEYTNKISGLNLESIRQGKIKEAEAVLKNDKSSPNDKKRAEMTKKILEETDVAALSRDELVKGSDFNSLGIDLIENSEYFKILKDFSINLPGSTKDLMNKALTSLKKNDPNAKDNLNEYLKAAYINSKAADMALAIEVKSELYKSILESSAQYDTSLVDAVNQDISKIKDIANRITDITSGHQKNILTKNNSKLLDRTILNMTKYDKKLADVIKEKYSDTNIFQTMEYEDAMEILNQQVLLKEARDMNKRNRNRYNSINDTAKYDTTKKIALKGNVFTSITDTETELKKDNLNVDNDTLTTIFTGNEKEVAEALDSIKNAKSKEIVAKKLKAYKDSQLGLDRETKKQVKSGFEIEKYINKVKGDPNAIYENLSNLAQDDSNGNLVFSLLVELAEKDINKYNEVMKLFSAKVGGNAKKTFNAMESRLASVVGAMQFQKSEEPVLEAAIQFQEIINKMIRTGADKIKRIEASLGIIEGQINSSGEYASFSNRAKAASKRMDLSTAQNQQEYVENMVNQITPEEYAQNKSLQMAYNKARYPSSWEFFTDTSIKDHEMDNFSNNWLYKPENAKFLNKAQNEFAEKYKKNAREVMKKASQLTPEEIKTGRYQTTNQKQGKIKDAEIDSKVLAEATRQRGNIDKYFSDLGITENDIIKAKLSITDESNKRAAMAALGESKYIKDADIAAIPNFIGEIYNIRGKIDEAAYKYNKVYGTDVTKNIQYGKEKDKDGNVIKYSDSQAESDVARLDEINAQVTKIKKEGSKEQIDANKALLEKLAREKSQIEEKIKINNSINQIQLDELNRIKQFYIELKKASYEFNRSIGYGVQFADMGTVTSALINKRKAETTISENRDKILKDENVGSIKYNPETQKYEIHDKNNNVIADDIHTEELKNINDAYKIIQTTSIDIESLKNYKKDAVSDEIGIQTKVRDMYQYLGDNSDAGKNKKKQAQRELDIEKANLFETLFDDINKSLSDLPSVQLTMLENQKQMKKNELEIWKTQEDSSKKTLEMGKLKAEIATKEIEIAKYKLEIQKQIMEKEKNIFELQNQRYEMLGIHKYNPEEKYIREVKNAKDVFALSSQELDIEGRRAKLSIENTDAIRKLTAVILRSMIKEDGDKETLYWLYKNDRDNKKKKGKNGEKTTEEDRRIAIIERENEEFKIVYQAEENAKNTTKIDETDSKRIMTLKQVEAIEQYITSLYKARMDYIDNMTKKYEGVVTGATALITGDKSKIKYEKPDLNRSLFTAIGAGIELKELKKGDYIPNEAFDKLLSDDKAWDHFITKADKKYQDEYRKADKSSKEKDNEAKENILKMKQTDDFKKLMAQAAVQTLVGVFDVINEASVNKLKLELAGLQHEQRILEMRKSGYRTEYAKYSMDKHIQANKRKQIETEMKIAEKEKEAQNGALFGSVGQGLLSSGEPHAMAAGAALMILQKPLGKLFDDGSAKIEKERKLAEFNTEESFKEYGMFWDRFFKVIEKMTSYAEQKIESMTSDYNKSRNLTRRNKTISQIREEAQIITDSVNDFEAIASATKTVKSRTWYGKKKRSDVTTDWNFAMDNLSREQILNYANMTDEQLKSAMIDQAKNDNKDAEGSWNVTDESLYDFRKSLQDASEAISYLDRMISDSNLSNKEFYSGLEGFAVDKESEIKNQYNEQIASALSAGDTATATMLTSMRDSEVKRFKDSGVTEIYYSIFSQLMYETAEKVVKDTGNFSDAFSSGIGTMIGTTFKNTIDEIMKKGIVDNSYLDEWATKFYEGMKSFTGNISNFINNKGVLDINSLSESLGAGSISGLLSNKAEWDKLNNISIYNTSANLASQLRNSGLDEVSISKILESAGLKDILKEAVNEIADIFNPVGLSSAKLKIKKDQYEEANSKRAEELKRKKILGTASADELKELSDIENGYLKLSIEENVFNGFKSGIEAAIKETSYTNIFSKFGSMIGDAISKTALKNLNLDNAAQTVADLLTAGNYAEAGKEIRNISLTSLAIAKQNEETAKKLRQQGLDWTEIYGTGLVSNIYQEVTNELSSQNSLKNVSAKYKKSEIDFSNTMATDKYNNSEYYNELMNRKTRGDFISENETIWIEQYESSLTNITNKQNLLNSLQSSFNSMLSNKTGLDYLKQVSQSIGQTIDEMIMQKINVDFTMESLIEKIVGGKNANKEISELSKVYQSAKSTQELIKNQMLSNGASYSLIEQMFGEDVSSTIADVYSEMQNYSNALGRISYQEEHYKKEIISVNGVLFQYDEYYRELNLKKANGISLTESEIVWMNRYTDTMKKFETNKKVVTEFYSAVGESFKSEELLKSFSSFADSFNNILKEKIIDGYLSNELSNDMANMISIAQNALSTGTVSDLYSAQKQMMAFSAKIQTVKNQTQGLMDMFDSSKIIDFTDKTKDVTYNASSSKETVYNITQNLSVEAGAVIGDGVSLDKLAKTLAPYLSKELKKY